MIKTAKTDFTHSVTIEELETMQKERKIPQTIPT